MILNKLREDSFIRHNFIFFIGSLLVAFFNYLYHPVLGRMMDIESFGEVQAVISLSLVFGMAIGVFRNIIINIVANAKQVQEKQEIILVLQKIGLYVALASAALILAFSRQLESFLNFSSYYPFYCLAAIMVLSLFYNFRSAILQAKQRFAAVSIGSFLLSAGRLAFAAALVYLGWSTFGAIGAIVLSQILALAYVWAKTKNDLPVYSNIKIKITPALKNELRYGLLILAATSCVTFMYSADIIIVKHYFPADAAGYYGGIATIARVIFFLTASVAGVLISHVKLENPPAVNRAILAKGMALVAAAGGGALLIFALFPVLMITLLIGARYAPYAELLPQLSLMLFLVSIINTVFTYYLSLRKYFLAWIAIGGPAAALLLSYFFHGSLAAIIGNFLWASAGILLIFCVKFFASFRKTG